MGKRTLLTNLMFILEYLLRYINGRCSKRGKKTKSKPTLVLLKKMEENAKGYPIYVCGKSLF